MARGQAAAANNQLNLTNNTATQAGTHASGLYSALEPQYAQMATNPTASPLYSAARTASRQALGGSTAGITGQGNLEAARTRNSAGYAPALDEGMRTAGQIESQNAEGDVGKIANAGLQGLSNLYGTNVGQQDTLLGLGPGTLEARAAGPSIYSGVEAFGKLLGGR